MRRYKGRKLQLKPCWFLPRLGAESAQKREDLRRKKHRKRSKAHKVHRHSGSHALRGFPPIVIKEKSQSAKVRPVKKYPQCRPLPLELRDLPSVRTRPWRWCSIFFGVRQSHGVLGALAHGAVGVVGTRSWCSSVRYFGSRRTAETPNWLMHQKCLHVAFLMVVARVRHPVFCATDVSG